MLDILLNHVFTSIKCSNSNWFVSNMFVIHSCRNGAWACWACLKHLKNRSLTNLLKFHCRSNPRLSHSSLTSLLPLWFNKRKILQTLKGLCLSHSAAAEKIWGVIKVNIKTTWIKSQTFRTVIFYLFPWNCIYLYQKQKFTKMSSSGLTCQLLGKFLQNHEMYSWRSTQIHGRITFRGLE